MTTRRRMGTTANRKRRQDNYMGHAYMGHNNVGDNLMDHNNDDKGQNGHDGKQEQKPR